MLVVLNVWVKFKYGKFFADFGIEKRNNVHLPNDRYDIFPENNNFVFMDLSYTLKEEPVKRKRIRLEELTCWSDSFLRIRLSHISKK